MNDNLKVEYADVRISNKDIANRDYDISASVRIEGTNVQSFSQGVVMTKDDGTSMVNQLATFDMQNATDLSVRFQTADNRIAILTGIEAFIAKAKNNSSSILN